MVDCGQRRSYLTQSIIDCPWSLGSDTTQVILCTVTPSRGTLAGGWIPFGLKTHQENPVFTFLYFLS